MDEKPWYSGVTRYQWLVLVIACAGWAFDQYESQIYNITRNEMLTEIIGGDKAAIARWGDYFLAISLLGGTIGGLGAGSMADRFGRRPILILTILLYSLFSGLTYFATELWHVGVLRFLVSMGVGGEWAVAASLVAEVFPARGRAHASGIFHATSVLGIWMAALAALAVGQEWRYAYLIGIVPALLILWVRASVREPELWQAAADEAKQSTAKQVQLGSFRELFGNRMWRYRALMGMALAAVGLGTFWAVTIAGQDLAREMLLRHDASADVAASKAKFAYGILQTTGAGLGLLSFGPFSARVGRRWAFIVFHLLAFAIVPITCFVPQTYGQLQMLLPVFGFFTVGLHAGYAIYFPELFPTHLRSTGASFCFNGGRVAAAPVMFLSGHLKGTSEILPVAVSGFSLLFLLGVVLILFLPETNKQELPE